MTRKTRKPNFIHFEALARFYRLVGDVHGDKRMFKDMDRITMSPDEVQIELAEKFIKYENEELKRLLDNELS